MEYGKVKVGGREELRRLKKLGRRCPKQLWYRGKWDKKLFAKCAAAVGSRRMTSYGERVVGLLVPRLVEEGFTIVSGFMYGVDQAVHREAIACGGRTIAVLGWGINEHLDTSDQHLADGIIESGGLVVSEWEVQAGALWTFPMRNRIVAALCSNIYVVEAAAKSGALITADMGRSLGKRVWAVPGPVTSKVSEGTNRLIADGLAKMWIPSAKAAEDQDPRYANNAKVYIALQNEALTVDELVRKTGKTAEEIGAQLTMALLRGEVVEKEGKYYLAD